MPSDCTKLEELLRGLARETSVLQEQQKQTTENINKLTNATEHLLEALGDVKVIDTKITNMEKRLDAGSPTIQSCDRRGHANEERIHRLELVVFGGAGLILVGVLAKLLLLIGINIKE